MWRGEEEKKQRRELGGGGEGFTYDFQGEVLQG